MVILLATVIVLGAMVMTASVIYARFFSWTKRIERERRRQIRQWEETDPVDD